jgi:two-component system cell cycle response regulator DivK
MIARSPNKAVPPRRAFLYIDDNDAGLSVARGVLEERNLVLLTAADTKRAFTLARRTRPEAMLVNLDLASVDAAALLQLLRGNPATQAAPVLALGRNAAAEAAVKALDAGFFLYLVSPLDARHFAEALDYALEFSALERTEL